MKNRIYAALLLLMLVGLSYYVYAYGNKETRGFRLGLDLAGGTALTYKADISKVEDVDGAMSSLRDVIERRINQFGVSEPVVQVEKAGGISGREDNQLIVELPGVTDINQAIDLIGKTPLLEFKLAVEGAPAQEPATPGFLEQGASAPTSTASTSVQFIETGLTGELLEKAILEFDPNTRAATIGIQFNSRGSDLFAEVTRNNVGKVLAIFLDNEVISAPVIRDEITGGKAQISGNFTPEEARTLVRDLNYGALPVPIELVSTQSIGPSLGRDALFSGLRAGIYGLIVIALFLILWYRLPGLVATVALLIYVALSLTLFKLIPVTLTAAGLAGFILSIGMAVDANVLIFERMKEEFKKGKSIEDGMHEGFKRAWLSIRDSNVSSLITAVVLFWLGTSAVKGFALTLGVGVLVSMFTAITASRLFLYSVSSKKEGKLMKFLFSNGLHANISNQ
jgi:preprotein translocase subunit SecD